MKLPLRPWIAIPYGLANGPCLRVGIAPGRTEAAEWVNTKSSNCDDGGCNSMRRNRGGRPKGSVKLTAEIITVIQQSLRDGYTIKGACREAGIHYSSFRRWRILGKEKRRGIYREFHQAIDPIFTEKRHVGVSIAAK